MTSKAGMAGLAGYPTGLLRRVWQRCCDTWVFEILSAAFSTLCIIAIFVFLRVLNRKETPFWSTMVSPNAIIAVASTASKGSAILTVASALGQFKWLHLRTREHSLKDIQVYDSATRGPLGALMFMWHFKKAPWFTYWAYIGCAVTLLSIAVDPFTQQVLRYHIIPTKDSSIRTTLPHTHNYDFGSDGLGGTSNYVSGLRDPGATAAAMSGFFGNPFPLQFECPSSNCTFQDFTTLGVESYCKNVTKQTTHDCVAYALLEPGTTLCNYALPGTVTLQASDEVNAHVGFGHTYVNATSNSYILTGTRFANISLIKFTSKTINDDGSEVFDWRKSMEAWECSLNVVAFAYSNVSVESGVLRTPNIEMASLESFGTNSTHGVLSFRAASPTWPENTTYGVREWDFENLGFIISIDMIGDNPDNSIFLAQNALSTSSNVSAKFEAVARSMTHHMMSGSRNTTILQGTAYLPGSYIRVVWGWAALLVGLNVLTWILLVLAIVLTSLSNIPTWKSSVYPLLTLNVRQQSVLDPDEVQYRLSEMERLSEQVTARLFLHRASITT